MHWTDCSLRMLWLLMIVSMAQSSESWRTETTFDDCYEVFHGSSYFLTNLLHPKYKGKYFVWSWWRSCMTAAPEASSRASRSYCRSMCIHRWFRPIFSFISIDWMLHVVWWTSVANCKCKVSPALISIALHLPSSSAAIEGVFSNFGLVQSKLRNQLGLEKAAKLVTCYRQLCGNAELNWFGTEMNIGIDQDKLWNI